MLRSLKEAEVFVRKTPNARWDNYSIVFHQETSSAEYRRDGARHPKTGVWGIETRFDVNDKGQWIIPNRYR